METLLMFATSQQARDYRREHGTGGWIFQPTDTENAHYNWHQCVLFPPSMPPAQIFNHPITKGRMGKLIGC